MPYGQCANNINYMFAGQLLQVYTECLLVILHLFRLLTCDLVLLLRHHFLFPYPVYNIIYMAI